jgi:polysaccharide deacetylase family protein (PEP-CTERM system associated)
MMEAEADRGTNILTVDYEDWFHILEPKWTEPLRWESCALHIEADTLRLLDLLDRFRCSATFFAVGWLAQRTPDTIREIVRRGHEVATHGYHHAPPETVSLSRFRDDLERSIDVIQSITSTPVEGYRAPGFRIRNCAYPVLSILREVGLKYDASLVPRFDFVRSRMERCSHPHRPMPEEDFWEIPVSAVSVFGIPVPFARGGFFRHLPASIFLWQGDRVNRTAWPLVLHIHPRDLDPDGPRIGCCSFKQYRYYGGRRQTTRKLTRLLERRTFTSIERYLTAHPSRN